MSDDYNDQVEGFTVGSGRKISPELAVKPSLFTANWTSFGSGEFNPELALKLSFITPQVAVDKHGINFNVYQTINREDLQLLDILQNAPGPKELMIYSFDREGKRLPLYVVLSVYELLNFNLHNDWEESWEYPMTSFHVQATTEVRKV
jgi:hypothetical protein